MKSIKKMARYFLINKYFAEKKQSDSGPAYILWQCVASSDHIFWLERMGDKLVRKVEKSDLIQKYFPVNGDLIEAELRLINKNDLGHIRPWIYDLVIYPDDQGAWFGIHQSSIHLNETQRFMRQLQVKDI